MRFCFDEDETAYGDADDVAGDTVIEQNQSIYLWCNGTGTQLVFADRAMHARASDNLAIGPHGNSGTPAVRFYDGNTDGDYVDTGDNVLYALYDANYNVTGVVDAADGDVAERYIETPYGTVTVLNGADDKDGAVQEWSADAQGASDWGWDRVHQGLPADPESGLVYNRARYLHTSMGRWMQADPLGYPDGPNRHEAYRSNGLNGVDPTGLKETAQALETAQMYFNRTTFRSTQVYDTLGAALRALPGGRKRETYAANLMMPAIEEAFGKGFCFVDPSVGTPIAFGGFGLVKSNNIWGRDYVRRTVVDVEFRGERETAPFIVGLAKVIEDWRAIIRKDTFDRYQVAEGWKVTDANGVTKEVWIARDDDYVYVRRETELLKENFSIYTHWKVGQPEHIPE